MDVNLNDPNSIRAWVAVAPERHRGQLRALRRLPLFHGLIQTAIDGVSRGAPGAAAAATGSRTVPSESVSSQGALL
jgi:hypothetical protein